MLSFSTIIIVVILALIVWAWSNNLRSREVAIRAVKAACQQYQLQFLDGTTHFKSCRPKRLSSGRAGIARRYGFDYYDGANRYSGRVVIFSLAVIEIKFDHQPPVIENTAASQSNNIIPFPKQNRDDDT